MSIRSSRPRRTVAAFGALALSAAVITAISPPEPAQAAPPSSGYTQIWNEEFNGTSLDTGKWSTHWGDTVAGNPYFVDQTAYNPSYVSVHDGYAWLKTDDTPTTINGVNLPYQTGFLSTKGKFEAQYGYVEARMRHAAAPTPSAPDHTGIGAYHAFWMMPHYNDATATSAGSVSLQGIDVNGVEGRGTEIDIMEWDGADTGVRQNTFWGGYGSGGTGFQGPSSWTAVNNPGSWHTYGLEWTPTTLNYYVDGNLTKTFSRSSTRIPFYPEFLMIQTGIVKWQPTPTNLPDYLQVDYVRYYQQPDIRYQAELETRAGGAAINTNHSGYTGSGFVDGFAGNNGASLTTRLDQAVTASQNVSIRYSAGPISGAPANRTLGLYLNGTKVTDVTFTGTANWETWATRTVAVTIPGGANQQLSLRGERADNSDGVNIDWIALPNNTAVESGNRVSNPQFGSYGSSFGNSSPKIQNPGGGWFEWSPSNAHNDASYIEFGKDYSDKWNLTHWKASAYTVYTGQTISLPNGTYTLSAWVQSGGGQNQLYMEAKDYGGTARTQNIPTTSTWTKISIPGVVVTNGSATIGFYSNANPGNWALFDNVQLLPS